MRKLLAILLMALCMTGAAFADEAEVFTEGQFTYVLTDGGAVITDYTFPDGVMERLAIPETLDDAPVVGIDESALWHEYIVYTIEIPATMTMLPEGEFGYGTEIVLHPDTPCFTNEDGFLIDTRTNTLLHASPSAAEKPLPAVTRLGNECLKNWHAEGHIDLPDTLTSIGAGVFSDCVDVTGVTIPASVTEIGAYAFNCTALTEIQLPPGLTSIPHLMLSCNDITEITIPESVKYIGEWAFYLCPLTRVEIPAGCEFIEYEAFDPEVELVLLGDNTHLETLEEYAERTGQDWLLEDREDTFTCGMWEYRVVEDSAILTNWNWYDAEYSLPDPVVLPAELDGYPVVQIAHNALNTSEMDSEVSFNLVVPEGVRTLQGTAFMCCHNADTIHLPSTLIFISEGCFHHVGAEINVAAGNPLYEVQYGFLIDKHDSTLIYSAPSTMGKPLPAVRRVGESSLDNWCEWEMDAVFPEGVEEIGAFIFQDMALNSLTLPSTLRIIEQDAIDGEIHQPVEIPASVEMIQRGNFTNEENATLHITGNPHFETADEYEARTGYRHWLDNWADDE